MRQPYEISAAVRKRKPLIHCITNPISINPCANALLAIGARPMMAEHPAEVKEITRTADALVLNLGNITDVRMESMRLALPAAVEGGIPVALDAVGVACSALRREFAARLLDMAAPAVIKGNYSEIFALHCAAYRAPGVDADAAIGEEALCHAAAALARRYHTTILASGKTDIVTDGARIIRVRNGTPQLSAITGTGCMLGAICGAYLAVCPGMDAAAAACGALGACGEAAETAAGSGTFMVNLMNALSLFGTTKYDLDMEEMAYEAIGYQPVFHHGQRSL